MSELNEVMKGIYDNLTEKLNDEQKKKADDCKSADELAKEKARYVLGY